MAKLRIQVSIDNKTINVFELDINDNGTGNARLRKWLVLVTEQLLKLSMQTIFSKRY